MITQELAIKLLGVLWGIILINEVFLVCLRMPLDGVFKGQRWDRPIEISIDMARWTLLLILFGYALGFDMRGGLPFIGGLMIGIGIMRINMAIILHMADDTSKINWRDLLGHLREPKPAPSE